MTHFITPNKFFAKLSPVNWWQLLIDAKDHHLGPARFEEEEPGYLKSMFSGLNYLLKNLNKPLSVDFLIELHDISISHTFSKFTTGEDSFSLEKIPPGLRGNYAVSFGLIAQGEEQNCTKEGLIELLTRLADGDNSFSIEEGIEFKLNSTTIIQPLTPEYIDSIWQRLHTGHCSIFTRKQSKAATIADLTTKIATYKSNIQQAKTTEEKLQVISVFIHDLEVFHCFNDANCRNFGVLVFKKLLANNGIPPAILHYRDRIDAYSSQEISIEAELGICYFEHMPTMALPSDAVILYLKDNDHLAWYIAEHALNELPNWTSIPFDERAKAISIVQKLLLEYDGVTSDQINSILETAKKTVQQSIYPKSFYQVRLFGEGKNNYGIHFDTTVNALLHPTALSLGKMKTAIIMKDKMMQQPQRTTEKLAGEINATFNELLLNLSRLHHTKKSMTDFYYAKTISQEQYNNYISGYVQALKLAPLATALRCQDKTSNRSDSSTINKLLYLILKEFLSEDFSKLDRDTQQKIQKESIEFILVNSQEPQNKFLQRAYKQLPTTPDISTLPRNFSDVADLYKPAFNHEIEQQAQAVLTM